MPPSSPADPAQRGAELAHGARNEILDMARRRDFDLGCSIAEGNEEERHFV